jgi:hypothetical protein
VKPAVLLLGVPAIAFASHPLITEDTGVLGKGVSQLELHGERIREQGEGDDDWLLTLSHGITDKTDFQVELPLNEGDALLSLKWRFLERDGLSFAFKPDVYEGGNWGANLVASYQAGRLELLAHAGYVRNGNAGERKSLRHTSAAILFSATEQLRLVLGLARDTEPDPAVRASVREWVLGAIYALSKDVDLGLGWMNGLSDPADDRSLRAGIKIRW